MAKNLIIKTVMDTKDFDKKYNEVIIKSEKLKKSQKSTNEEFDLFSDSIRESSDNIENLVEESSAGIGKMVKKFANWAIVLGTVAVAASTFKKAWQTVSERNSEVANKIQTIKNSFQEMGAQLLMTLEPVIIRIVDWIYKLTQYIAYVLKAWFGIESSASNTAKSSKEIKKSMAGFDTANTLSDNSSGGSSGAMALKPLDESEVPGWIKWIADHGNEVALIIAGIAAAIGVLTFVIGGPIMLGIEALIVAIGLIAAVVISNWDKISSFLVKIGDWIWKNVCVPIGNFIVALFETIFNHIKFWISLIQGIFTTVIEIILNPFNVAFDTLKSVFSSMYEAIKNLVSGIGKLFTGDLIGALNDFKRMFGNIFNALWSIAKAPINLLIGGLNALIKGINKISFDVPDWIPVIGGQKWGFNIPEIPKLAVGGIINNPGHGVPLGAIGGEAGREGILPLTDSQAMAELGKEIGKWINLNVNLTTKLDSRVLSKSLERVQNNNSFVRNGV